MFVTLESKHLMNFRLHVRNKGYNNIKCMSDRSCNNGTNNAVCNASLHQLSKTIEIVTGWVSSIAVLTKIMNVQVLC